jgi:CubicO group peptidase (beta-lactamase class C family)
MKSVDSLMKAAIADNVFPGGVVLVAKEDTILFFEAYGNTNIFTKRKMTRDTVFDLASLTKPLATTLAILNLIQSSKLALDQLMGSILTPFQKTDKAQMTIRHLLSHTSGLPAYRPYYKVLGSLPMEKRKQALRTLLLEEPLESPIGKKPVYSDLGFMILNWVVEAVAAQRLDEVVKETIYRPLGIASLFFIDLQSRRIPGVFAATEQCPWRECLIEGVVHDENAYAAGGIEGHAGLFGTTYNVYHLLATLLRGYHGGVKIDWFETKLVRLFFKRQESANRALGFDMPSDSESSTGNYFSKHTVGHLGFTGTSFWMDLDRAAIVILLTNRIHPTRTNEKIKAFRPKLHNAAMIHILRKSQSGVAIV